MAAPARQLALHATDGTLALATRAEDTWLALADLRAAFDSTSDRGRQDKAERWARELPAALTQRRGRSLYVRGDARLPDNLTAVAFVRTGQRKTWNGFAVPADFDSFTPADRQRFSDTHLLLDRWESFRAANRNLPEAALVARFAAHMISEGDGAGTTIADWCAALPSPLRVSERTLREYKARVTPGSDRFDGNRDKRGRKSGTGACGVGLQPANEIIADTGEVLDAAWEYFKSLWLAPKRRSIQLCWELTSEQAEQQGWTWPSIHVIRRRVASDLGNSVADYHRKGPKRWAGQHLPRIQRDRTVLRPMQSIVGDHHKLDFLCVHRGKLIRPHLTAWQCERSRAIVAWSVVPSGNSDSILATLAATVQQHGAPDVIYCDNGKDYTSGALESFCERVQIERQFARPFNPQSKCVERFFGTVCERFSKSDRPECAAYIGGMPEARPEDLYKQIAKGKIELPSLEQVAVAFGDWLETDYHIRPHSAEDMQGLTPSEMFHRDAIARRTLPAEQLRLLLMRQQVRTVSRHGLTIDGVTYGHGSIELMRFNGKKVLVAISDADRSQVEVYTEDGRERICVATNHALTDATSEDMRAALATQRRAAKAMRAAGPAIRDAHRSREGHVQRAVAQRLPQQTLLATGTDDRPLRLISGDAALMGMNSVGQVSNLSGRAADPIAPMPVFEDEHSDSSSAASMPVFDDVIDAAAGASMPQFDEPEETIERDTPADRFARLGGDD